MGITLKNISATEKLYQLFKYYDYELPHDIYCDAFQGDGKRNKNSSRKSLQRNYGITIRKYKNGEEIFGRKQPDVWIMIPPAHELKFNAHGKFDLIIEDDETSNVRKDPKDPFYRTPCMIPIRDMPGAICESGDKCAQGGHCPIAKHIPWYQQDHRQEARQALRRLGYRKKWRFQL